MSAFAFATPAAIVPIPEDATSFTPTRAFGFICFNHKLTGPNPQLSKCHDEEGAILKSPQE